LLLTDEPARDPPPHVAEKKGSTGEVYEIGTHDRGPVMTRRGKVDELASALSCLHDDPLPRSPVVARRGLRSNRGAASAAHDLARRQVTTRVKRDGFAATGTTT